MTTVNVDTTLIERPTAFANVALTTYKICKAMVINAVRPVAGGAGQVVTVALAFVDNNNVPINLPSTNYAVFLTPDVACTASVSSKTVAGCNAVFTPLSSGVTLAAGFFDATIVWTL